MFLSSNCSANDLVVLLFTRDPTCTLSGCRGVIGWYTTESGTILREVEAEGTFCSTHKSVTLVSSQVPSLLGPRGCPPRIPHCFWALGIGDLCPTGLVFSFCTPLPGLGEVWTGFEPLPLVHMVPLACRSWWGGLSLSTELPCPSPCTCLIPSLRSLLEPLGAECAMLALPEFLSWILTARPQVVVGKTSCPGAFASLPDLSPVVITGGRSNKPLPRLDVTLVLTSILVLPGFL